MTIQEIGTEILGGNPGTFYVFGGKEYGVKKKYIEILQKHYGVRKEVTSVSEILSVMSTKHFIPMKPTVYVVRYDAEFIKSLSDAVRKQIKSTNIVGTIVCIYDSDKDVAKCEKYLPDNTVRIDSVSRNFMLKYLHSDFPNMPDRLIEIAADHSADYNHARTMCACMSTISVEELYNLDDDSIVQLFGRSALSSEDAIKKGIAARNFNYLVSLVDSYPGDISTIFYSVLSTMIELEKVKSTKYSSSEFRDYAKRWTMADIYNMFMNTYAEIRKLRSYAVDAYSSLMYILSLMQFSQIPSLEDLS